MTDQSKIIATTARDAGSKQPLLSIIIPTCNRGRLLEYCLQKISIAVGFLPENSWEVIVTVDGEEAPDFHTSLRSFDYVKGPNRGPASNRNNGAAHASGDWLIFIDDDCTPDPQIFRAYTNGIRPGVFVYEGKTTCHRGLRSALDHAPANTNGGCLWSCNFMISRAVFDRVGKFDEAFSYAAMEDVDLRERLRAAEYQICFLPEAIVDHPPRKIRGLDELRRHYISMAYYTVQKRGEPLKMRALLSTALKTRLLRIITASDRTESFKAARLLVCELIMIVRYTRSWERSSHAPEHA